MTTKVIFHIDEADKWEMVIANLTNLCKSIDTQDAAVELLANSNAVLSFIRNWRQDTRNKRAKRLRRQFYMADLPVVLSFMVRCGLVAHVRYMAP